MSGHVEFRDNADAAIGRVGNYIPNLILSIEMAIRTQFLQARIEFALQPEALII